MSEPCIRLDRAALEEPFDSSEIRQRPGAGGSMLDYVEGHAVIGRLNACLESQWSFAVLQYQIQDDEVLVLGELRAAGVCKQQFGSASRNQSLGDDCKAAATDALKKAATLLGVGLHLYRRDALEPANQARQSAKPQSGVQRPSQPPSQPDGGGISAKQRAYLLSLAAARGIGREQLEQLAAGELDRLSRSQASVLIDTLKEYQGA